MSEIAVTALPARSADWKQRKPVNVASAASAVHPDSSAPPPWAERFTDTALIAASATPYASPAPARC
jgi:hypothetical protein